MQVRFTANFTGKPVPDIKWFKDSEEVTPSKNIKITSDNSLSTLLIKSIAAEHSGRYTITATNDGGEVSAEADLTVEGASVATSDVTEGTKPCITTKLSDQTVELTEDVSLKISYEGNPKPEIQWEKNGHAIVSIKLSKTNSMQMGVLLSHSELTKALFNHMKGSSSPGIDGFTVNHLRTFWDDL